MGPALRDWDVCADFCFWKVLCRGGEGRWGPLRSHGRPPWGLLALSLCHLPPLDRPRVRDKRAAPGYSREAPRPQSIRCVYVDPSGRRGPLWPPWTPPATTDPSGRHGPSLEAGPACRNLPTVPPAAGGDCGLWDPARPRCFPSHRRCSLLKAHRAATGSSRPGGSILFEGS